MSNNKGTPILFPAGRFVGGSLTTGKTTDYYGKPLTNGDGTPAADYSFACAIAKDGRPWWETEWGKVIHQAGVAAFPTGQTSNPSFAWKVTDGDSQVPNKKGKKPCDNEGWPGHWVVWFSSRFAPKTVNSNGSAQIDPALIKPGHFIQVYGDVKGNGSTESPGMFINHNGVAHAGFGPEINFGADLSNVGFGSGPLPAGASAVPVGGMTPAQAQANAGTPTPPAAATPAASAPPVTPATVVQPHTTILNGGAAPTPPAPPAPPAPARQMTAKANGATYESFIAAGWDDATLVREGMMTA